MGHHVGDQRAHPEPLEVAIKLAAEAGEWGAVSALARQLEGKRAALADPKVVALDSARRDRRG